MKKLTIGLGIALSAMVLTGGIVFADRYGYEGDDDERHERDGLSRWLSRDGMAVDSEQTRLYQEECGSCHFAFQPGFLPAESWQAIMAGLDDHFGDDATLADDTRQTLLDYLTANAAGNNDRGFSDRLMWSLRDAEPPLRITETGFFRHEHREIPRRVLEQQPDGRKLSFANCDSCHTGAAEGSFNEHEVRIPGYGRWDD